MRLCDSEVNIPNIDTGSPSLLFDSRRKLFTASFRHLHSVLAAHRLLKARSIECHGWKAELLLWESNRAHWCRMSLLLSLMCWISQPRCPRAKHFDEWAFSLQEIWSTLVITVINLLRQQYKETHRMRYHINRPHTFKKRHIPVGKPQADWSTPLKVIPRYWPTRCTLRIS